MADRYYRKIKKSFDEVKYKLQFTALELNLKKMKPIFHLI